MGLDIVWAAFSDSSAERTSLARVAKTTISSYGLFPLLIVNVEDRQLGLGFLRSRHSN